MRSQWLRLLASAALPGLLVGASAAEDFHANVVSSFHKSEAKSAVLHESKPFRVTVKLVGNGEQRPLFRATSGTFMIFLNRFKAVVLSEERILQRNRGHVAYLPTQGVGGGLRFVVEPHVKFGAYLEVQVSPRTAGAEASVPVPAAEADAARKERSGPRLIVNLRDLPPLAKGKMANIAKLLDAPDAQANLLTVAGKTTLSKSNYSSLWFVFGGRGSLRVGGKPVALQPNTLLVLPVGAPNAITLAPDPGKGLKILLITHKTL